MSKKNLVIAASIVIILLLIYGGSLSPKRTQSVHQNNGYSNSYNKPNYNSSEINTNSELNTNYVGSELKSKAKADYYRALADQVDSKIKSQEDSVKFAKENLDNNPSSATALMLYNSENDLLNTYYNQKDKYLELAAQYEAR